MAKKKSNVLEIKINNKKLIIVKHRFANAAVVYLSGDQSTQHTAVAKRKAEEAWAPYQKRAVQAIRSRRGEEKKVRPIRLPTKWTRKSEEPIGTVPRPS